MKLETKEKTITVRGSEIKIKKVKMTCPDGFCVVLSSIGAGIDQILMPFPDGSLRNIALSFEADEVRADNDTYAGATLAPAAGQIKDGHLKIGKQIFALDKNENGNHTLHGGSHNASFVSWQLISARADSTQTRAVFAADLKDGLDGFPGDRHIQAIYTLSDDRTLTIGYEAVSNKDTYFNLSNHTYYNLSGDFSVSCLEQKAQIRADNYFENRADAIPEHIRPVEGTPFDMRDMVSFSDRKNTFPEDAQLAYGRGWNNGYLLKEDLPDDACDFALQDKDGLMRLEGRSDAPCLIVYTGGYFPEGIRLKSGQTSCPSCACAFEFEDAPDLTEPSASQPQSRFTPAGIVWHRNIELRFLSADV